MNYKYYELITNEFKKYYKNYYEFDYDGIIKMCIDYYYQYKMENTSYVEHCEFRNNILGFILDLSYYLNKKELKKYISVFKKNKANKIFSIRIIDSKNIDLNPNLYRKVRHSIALIVKKYTFKSFILRFFPLLFLKFHLTSIGNSPFSNKRSTKKKLRYYLNFDDKFSIMLKKIISNYLCLDYIELVVTIKCTLRCKDCANLMYKYKKPYEVDLDTIKSSIQKLLSCVDHIKHFRILGGEPFLNPHLKDILEELNSSKLEKIVIVTNGTVVPKDKGLIKELQRKNVHVEISDYGKLSYNKEKLIEFLKENNIHREMPRGIHYWVDYGEPKYYHNDINYQFLHCDNICKSLLNGKIYYCPRQSHGVDLGIIKDNKNEYIDLLNNTDKENRKLLKQYMFKNKPISACNYCKYATKDCTIIETAIQKGA